MDDQKRVQAIIAKIRFCIKDGINPETNKPYYNHAWEVIEKLQEEIMQLKEEKKELQTFCEEVVEISKKAI